MEGTNTRGMASEDQIRTKKEQMRKLIDQRLWHQLSGVIEETVVDPAFQAVPGLLIEIYNSVLKKEDKQKINPLKLVQIAVTVSQQFARPQDACNFLEESKNLLSKESDREPLLFLDMNMGQLCLQDGNTTIARDAMTKGLEILDEITDADPSVIASVYSLCSQYHKIQRNFDEYYKNTLLYLAYVSADSLPADFRLALAVDISLAALLGDGIFNFGELLLHPIVNALLGTEYEWIHALLKCFNKGDIHAYELVCQKYADALNGQPELVKKADSLKNKITLLFLVEYLFSLPPEYRSVPLTEIANRAKLQSVEEAEFLIIKAMAKGMVKGIINQVHGVVQVDWVQPRILTHDQVKGLTSRLDQWSDKLNTTQKLVNEMYPTNEVGVIS